MSKVNSYVSQFIALAQGENAEATAIKNQRLAKANVESQIAALRGKLVNSEMELEQATEGMTNARLSGGKLIANGNSYVENLFSAQNNMNEKKEALEQIKSDIAFLEEQLGLITATEETTPVAEA